MSESVSEQELQQLREEARTKEVCLRSCWNCNPAHEGLKKASYVICCFDCGGYFYKGVEITE